MKHLIYFTFPLVFIACETNSTSTQDGNTAPYKVEFMGALKDMMHKGDISAKADLQALESTPHLYALGALENLKGEIQIFDGQPFHSMVEDSALNFDQSFDKKATLLVYAAIEEWNRIPIPDTVVSREQLDQYIQQAAVDSKMDANKPFPFLIEGTVQSLEWHVINWKDGDTEHSHEKHIRSGLFGKIENEAVEVLGFYSNSHHAIFTHHTTNMHMHVKTSDGELAGHVDDLTLGAGMVLKLPANP